MKKPSINGTNGTPGKDPQTGRFLPGNKLGTGGDPYQAKKLEFRAMMLKASTKESMGAVIAALFREAQKGESWAVKEVLDRFLGKAPDVIEVGDQTASMLSQIRETLYAILSHPELARRVENEVLDAEALPASEGGGE